MVRITETLVRQRSEHNNLEISTLEELSLHQQDLEKIEYLDKWCKDLRILYLQSNLIPKIENVSRLKKLEYLNLALNNIEIIENLEGCESLKKLDLTVNFVGEITSVTCLKDLPHFEELYLVGNPCTEYEGYREYIIATLPQLKKLDGIAVEKSERIKAHQEFYRIEHKIREQQNEHRKKRVREKLEAENKKREKERLEKGIEDDSQDQKSKPGFDGKWYTDINKDSENSTQGNIEKQKKEDELVKEFWEEKTAYTPESRIEVHEHSKALKEKENKKNVEPEKKPRRLLADDGRRLNINEAKIDFTLTDNENKHEILLDLAIFKHMDTSLIDVDVQPDHVLASIKGKIFQLALNEEVKPDSSTAQRSQVTGHLLITMPKAKDREIKPVHKIKTKPNDVKAKKDTNKGVSRETLEVDPSKSASMDFANIVQEKGGVTKAPFGAPVRTRVEEKPNSEDFIDNPDVPPLM